MGNLNPNIGCRRDAKGGRRRRIPFLDIDNVKRLTFGGIGAGMIEVLEAVQIFSPPIIYIFPMYADQSGCLLFFCSVLDPNF